jgi:hypothetical protein
LEQATLRQLARNVALRVSRLPLYQRIWPDTPEFRQMAVNWGRAVSAQILECLWHGCDDLTSHILDHNTGVQSDDSQIERRITQLLVPYIRSAKNGFDPFQVEHELYEFETAESDKAQPPQYDIGFIHNTNPCLIWPVEAKVLRSDRNVGEYVKEIRKNFLTCRYAPFVDQAGMLGYLLSGSPTHAFATIAKKVPCELHDHPNFPDRNHKTSEHKRKVPEGKHYPSSFRCHHMILCVGRVHAS